MFYSLDNSSADRRRLADAPNFASKKSLSFLSLSRKNGAATNFVSYLSGENNH
jgi:hypothetical protein